MAYSCSSLRSVRLRERKPLPMGVVMGPFSPMRLRCTGKQVAEAEGTPVRPGGGRTELGRHTLCGLPHFSCKHGTAADAMACG